MQESGLLFLSVLAGSAVVAAFFAVLNVLFGGVVDRAALASADTPGRSFLVGVINIIFLGIIALGFIALSRAVGLEFFQIPALIVGVFLVVCIAFGMAGMSRLVGARLIPTAGENAQIALGGVALTFASAMPYVGWFGLLPYLILRGVGGLIVGLFPKPPAQD